MSTTTAQNSPARPTSSQRPTARKQRRGAGASRWAVLGTQAAIVVVLVASWESLVRAGALDPLLYGQPSRIVEQLVFWVTEGTPNGSLGTQILITLEEALIGFAIGTALGIVFGVGLGRIDFLARVWLREGRKMSRVSGC